MVTTKLNLSMTEPSVRQIYAKQGDTGRVLDITLDQTPEDGTLRILRPDGVEVTSEAVTGGEIESGSTFESLTEADVTELTVGIEPVQDLNGYDKPWVGGAGANKWDEQWEVGNITTVGTNGTATDRIRSKEYIPVLPSTAYYRVSPNNLQLFYYDANKEFLSYGIWGTGAFTTPANASYVRFQVDPAYGTTYRNNIAINYPSSATAYAPYSNICPITGHDEVRVFFGAEQGTADETYTTSLGQTVYGGTLDMVSGVLTVTHGNIASYNGETLPSTWISDRDVYASGTTPTTGAQVVYELATPLTYQLTAQQIKTLVGTNNVWASSGDIVNITFTYGGLLSELPSDATSVVGKCYCDVEQNGVSSMPFTLNVKKNERQ